MREKPTFDTQKVKKVRNRDGSVSTVDTFSTRLNGEKHQTVLPTVIDGKRVSENEAIAHYRTTGKHYGRYDTVKEAEDAATKLHEVHDMYTRNKSFRKNVDASTKIRDAYKKKKKKDLGL